jgi:hypothetical protein
VFLPRLSLLLITDFINIKMPDRGKGGK